MHIIRTGRNPISGKLRECISIPAHNLEPGVDLDSGPMGLIDQIGQRVALLGRVRCKTRAAIGANLVG